MGSQISVEVILLVILVCGAYYATHKNTYIILPERSAYEGNPQGNQGVGADDR